MQNETVRALKDIYETQCLHAKNLIVLAEAVNGAIAIIKQNPPRAEGEYGAMNKLIAAYDEYIALLGAELDELSGFAATHGWKSTRYEAGRLCRRKIESAKITAKIAEGK